MSSSKEYKLNEGGVIVNTEAMEMIVFHDGAVSLRAIPKTIFKCHSTNAALF